MPADAGFGAIIVQVGKIRCLVAGGSVFKPGTVLEVFAGFKEIPSDVSATSYPLKLRFGSAYYEKPWLVEANGDVVFPADNLTRNLGSGTLEQLVLSGDGRLRLANMSVRTTIIPYVEGSRFGDIGPSESDTLTRDAQGNLFVAAQNCLYMVPVVSGNYYGKAMTAGCIYAVAGNRATNGPTGEVNVPAISTRVRIGISGAGQIAVDAQGNLFFADNEGTAKRLRMVPRANGTYYDQVMTANRIYTLAETASWAVYNVGVDTTGSVYYTALNGLSINVCKVAPDGSLSATYAGEANSSFYHSFAMTGNGTCYVNGGGQLWRIAGGIKTTILAGNTGNSPDGTPLASAKTSAWLKLKATPEGHLYLMDHHNGCVRMIPATSGTYHGKAMLADHLYIVAGFQDVMTVDGVPRKRPLLPNVSGMQVDAQGTVYLASNKDSNPSHSQISIIPAVSGTYFGKAMTAGHHYIIHNLAYPEQLIGSKSIAPLSNGELYVATYSRKIYKIAMDGSVNLILSLTFYPWDIAVDAQDNLYIAGDGKVEILPAINGTYFGQAMTAGTRYTVPGSNALGRPWSVTLDALGNLYTQERVVSNNTQVRMIPNIAGTYFGQAMTVGNLYLLCTTATNYGTSSTVAEGLTLDAAGNLYVSSSRTTGTTSVTKFSAADGQSSHFAGGGTLGDGIPARQARLWPIESLAFGPGGALYLTQPNGVMRIH
ncbi:NHL repeat protein [compost metagenome]